jgi:hypothetical protein
VSQNDQTGIVKVVRDKGQYVLAFGVIASLLLVANIPIFVVFFFGIFGYFVAKMFATPGKHRTRSIFEFYLSAHEIIRDDMRSWYGFEISETIRRGEDIVKTMKGAPTLVHFALGSLYNKIGDHSSAAKHLAYVAENPESFEATVVYPSPELRNYVNVLRKIERDPASAPLTSAAVRSLERGRKIRTQGLLDQSREAIANNSVQTDLLPEGETSSANELQTIEPVFNRDSIVDASYSVSDHAGNGKPQEKNGKKPEPQERKPITELLHDIYDRSPQ